MDVWFVRARREKRVDEEVRQAEHSPFVRGFRDGCCDYWASAGGTIVC